MQYELTFESGNTEHYAKPITVAVVRPDTLDADTGLLHIAHGWGGNRYQYQEMQRDFAERYNVVAIATEYRQSGYDFNPVTGLGAYRPYDTSHLQVLDCLNAVRTVIALTPGVNTRRLLAFGGSQGAHITMLMAAFCPNTFALAIAGSGISRVAPPLDEWAGRDFSPDERAIRDAVRLVPGVRCPVVLMHGTADETVSHEHTQALEQALRAVGVEVRARYIEGGRHGLDPVTTRRDVTVEMADDLLHTARTDGPTDFEQASRIAIPCETQQFVIDWSKPACRLDPRFLDAVGVMGGAGCRYARTRDGSNGPWPRPRISCFRRQ